MKNLICKRKFLISIFAVILALSCLTAVFSYSNAMAEYSVDNASLNMVAGACVRQPNDEYTTGGLRYIMTMPKADYETLMQNVGEDKTYKSVEFGIFIAPSYYNDKYALNNVTNVSGDSAKYGWLTDEQIENGVSYADTEAGKAGRYQIINTQSDGMIKYADDESLYAFYGSVVNIKQENMLVEYDCAGYIRYTDAEGTHYKFAAKNDNVRSMTYVAQKAIENGADTDGILAATYVTPFAETDTEYQVNVYIRNEKGEYVKDAEQSGKRSAKVGSSVDLSSETLTGYKAVSNDNAKTAGIIYANEKSVFDLYYRAKNVICDFEGDDGARQWNFMSNQIDGYVGTITEEEGNASNHVLSFPEAKESWGFILSLATLSTATIKTDYSEYDFITMDVTSNKNISVSLFGSVSRKVSALVKTKILVPISGISETGNPALFAPLTENEKFTVSIDNIAFGNYDVNTYNEYSFIESGSNGNDVKVEAIDDPTGSNFGRVLSYSVTDDGSWDGAAEFIGFTEYLAWAKKNGYEVFSFDYYVKGAANTAAAKVYGKTLAMNYGAWTHVSWYIDDLQGLTDKSYELWLGATGNAFYFGNFKFEKAAEFDGTVCNFDSTNFVSVNITNTNATVSVIEDPTGSGHGKVLSYSVTKMNGIWDNALSFEGLSDIKTLAEKQGYTTLTFDYYVTDAVSTVKFCGKSFDVTSKNTWVRGSIEVSGLLKADNLFWIDSVAGSVYFDNFRLVK